MQLMALGERAAHRPIHSIECAQEEPIIGWEAHMPSSLSARNLIIGQVAKPAGSLLPSQTICAPGSILFKRSPAPVGPCRLSARTKPSQEGFIKAFGSLVEAVHSLMTLYHGIYNRGTPR